MRRTAALAVLLAAAACSHGEPYGFAVDTVSGAFQPGAVSRLTFNPGDDQNPAWFPDGNSFIYAVERRDRSDHDRCLAVMPAVGGTILERICQRKPSSEDSMDIFAVPSPSPDGRVAFMYSTFDLHTLTTYHTRDLFVGGLDSPLAPRNRLFEYPYAAPGGYGHDGIAEIAWRSPTQFAYVATLPHFPQPCKFCRPDVATPVQIVLVDLSGDTATAQPLANTIYATSIAFQGPDTLYFTLLGDGRVFRRVLSTGVETLVHDYGLTTIVRDVQVRGSRLLVIEGGSVNVELLIGMGFVQNDDGGIIHVFDLVGGGDTVIDTTPYLFRRGALSPDGHVLLAEARANAQDWDIYRIELP